MPPAERRAEAVAGRPVIGRPATSGERGQALILRYRQPFRALSPYRLSFLPLCPFLIEIGRFTLTASCLALASESAFWLVSASWSSFCDWPEPPQPYLQSDELSWVWSASW